MVATATMVDDIVAGNDPLWADGAAGYINGKWPDFAATAKRFIGKPTKSISIGGFSMPALAADIADMESGDYTALSVAQWASMKIAAGLGRPTIYCSTSNYGAVAKALAALGLLFGRDVDWWEAHYDNVAVISSNPGAIGKQYQSTASYDASIVLASWLFGAPAPSAARPDLWAAAVLL